MSDIKKDILIIRELSKKYAESTSSDKHIRMQKRFKDTNDLKIVRPPLIIEEIPWHEMNMDGELDCFCDDQKLRNIELSLRKALFREKHLKCDNYEFPAWFVYKSYSNTGNGFKVKEKSISRDETNNIRSHLYYDILKDEASLESYHDPVITPAPEKDRKNIEYMSEILGDTLPVVLKGHQLYYAPWDIITRLRGVESIMTDIYDRPEYLHKIIGLFTRAMSIEMDQMEKCGLYEPDMQAIHCTPAAFTHTDSYDSGFGKCKDIWFRTMAQSFSSISPDAHYEFDVQYSAPLAKRCAHTYYGCCEPLHDRIDILTKNYPNLRKIGVSPWANVEKSAEMIGGNYVLSRKPNPANVAISTDPDLIRREITETVELCLKYNCPCDITLKDISTVSYNPKNLIIWSEVASEVLDKYYGEA